jgi:hypothetical protein
MGESEAELTVLPDKPSLRAESEGHRPLCGLSEVAPNVVIGRNPERAGLAESGRSVLERAAEPSRHSH